MAAIAGALTGRLAQFGGPGGPEKRRSTGPRPLQRAESPSQAAARPSASAGLQGGRVGRWGRVVDEPSPVGDRRGLHATVRPELAEDVRNMDGCRSRADEQLVSDLTVRPAARNEPEDVGLAGREALATRTGLPVAGIVGGRWLAQLQSGAAGEPRDLLTEGFCTQPPAGRPRLR